MRLNYDNLQKISREARVELTQSGIIDPGKQRIRKKRRDAEKQALIYRMALDRLENYPPGRDKEGRLVLPYFTLTGVDKQSGATETLK
ncbi:MAG: hypothetical protein ACOYVJ_02365 [Nitrospirota bacterium]